MANPTKHTPCAQCASFRQGTRQRKPTPEGGHYRYEWSSGGEWGTCYGVPPTSQPSDDAESFPLVHEDDTCPLFTLPGV